MLARTAAVASIVLMSPASLQARVHCNAPPDRERLHIGSFDSNALLSRNALLSLIRMDDRAYQRVAEDVRELALHIVLRAVWRGK